MAVFASGCGDRLGSAAGPNLLRGGLHYSGGPPGANDQEDNQPGTVRLYRDGHKVAEQALRDGQEFAFRIERGTYVLSVDLGDFDCTRTVSIERPRVTADLLCQIK